MPHHTHHLACIYTIHAHAYLNHRTLKQRGNEWRQYIVFQHVFRLFVEQVREEEGEVEVADTQVTLDT